MGLSMGGHIDATFKYVTAYHIAKGGEYVDGIWISDDATPVPFDVNVQPLSDRELNFLQQGGERIIDPRRMWINSGNMGGVKLGDDWEFYGQRWKTIRVDYRPPHEYLRVTVDRYDDQ